MVQTPRRGRCQHYNFKLEAGRVSYHFEGRFLFPVELNLYFFSSAFFGELLSEFTEVIKIASTEIKEFFFNILIQFLVLIILFA